MRIPKFLLALSQQGIKLWLKDGDLKFSAPQGKFTGDLKQQVIERKSEIIEFLGNIEKQIPNQIARIERTEQMALSIGQQNIWSACQVQGNASIYNLVSSIIINEPISAGLYQRVVTQVTQDQEVFKARVKQNSGMPHLHLEDNGPLSLIEIDVSNSNDPQAEIKRLIGRERIYNFEFANEPLARFFLVKVTEEKFVVVINIHHIIFDAFSMGLLGHAMKDCLAAFKLDQPYNQDVLPMQYADYAAWHRDQVEAGQLDSQLEYWRENLRQLPPLLPLETDFQRSSVRHHDGNSISGNIPTHVVEKLQKLAKQQGATFYCVMLGIYNLLLSTYSGSRDIPVGTPVANRNHPQIQKILGYFVNTIVIRTQIDPNVTFVEFIQNVKGSVFSGQANQDLPFNILLEQLDIETSNSFSPLYQYSFSLCYSHAHSTKKKAYLTLKFQLIKKSPQ